MSVTRKIFTDTMGNRDPAEYIGSNGDVFYGPTGQMRLSDGSTPGGLPLPSNDGAFGCFHKLVNVTPGLANTVYAMDWFANTTAHINANGITVEEAQPTRLNVALTGNYKVFAELQIKSTANANRNGYVWFARNGVDEPDTCVRIGIRSSGGTDAYQIFAKQWLLDDIAAGDYLEMRYAVNNPDGITLEYTAAQTVPYVRPAVPSAVITITPV